jgi:hypothetical protein
MSRHACRYCGAPVRWMVTTPRGRTIPVDPDPHPDGTLVFLTTAAGLRVQACSRDALAAMPVGERRYTAHAATCARLIEAREARRAGTRREAS